MHFITHGILSGSDGEKIGSCQFDLYRRKWNRPWMEFDEIVYWMDAISESAQHMSEVLSFDSWLEAENSFNSSGLLVAERVQIEPQAQGQGAWKSLYFATMQKALEPLKYTPDKFYFKVFPLEFELKVTKKNMSKFKVAERALKLLYQIHLAGAPLLVPAGLGCYMKAPIPENLRK